jgi:hypothetical protein
MICCALLLLAVPSVLLSGAEPRFSFPGDGLVSDHRRGLVWMRCSVGQHFVDGRCAGDPEHLTWTDAQARLAGLATQDCPWRLPEFHELRSLISGAGGLDRQAFPDTPDGWFWTRVQAGGHSQYDCFVSFQGAGRTRCNMGGRLLLRPVMTGVTGMDACVAP